MKRALDELFSPKKNIIKTLTDKLEETYKDKIEKTYEFTQKDGFEAFWNLHKHHLISIVKETMSETFKQVEKDVNYIENETIYKDAFSEEQKKKIKDENGYNNLVFDIVSYLKCLNERF